MKATHDELEKIDRLIDLAFDEDIAQSDLTTESIFPDVTEATALLTAKAPGIISGIEIAQRVLDKRGSNKVQLFVNDGDSVQKGDKIMAITASYATLLTAERLLLNFMQRMSGIATETHRYVAACEGTNTHILDTRKTAPGLRLLDKMAVRHGGGRNHRMGLYDMIMLKDNHIKAVGSITKAVEMVRSQLPLSVKVEVETTCLKEVEETMSNEAMLEAVRLINHRSAVEASGNMTLERIREVAALGVDYISVGALTHSVKALDISMNFIQ